MGTIHLVRGLLCTTAVGLLYMPLPGMAQVIPDSTLGIETSVVTPLDANMDRIDGGALRNSLLFHSFEAFSIPEGHGVYFANPAFVNTIFSRVTGVDPSLLFGTLGVLGDADLMFINPNGILFGPNAALDLRGAFTATTATGVVFPGGEAFSALNPSTAPLLTVNVQAPVGIVFEGQTPGAIANYGSLEIDSGQELALIGGAIANRGNLQAPSGQITVAAVPSHHEVQLTEDGTVQSWGLLEDEFPDFTGLSIEALVRIAGLAVETLPAASLAFEAGTVVLNGTVDAASDRDVGGAIWVLGDRVALISAKVNASGTVGGTIRIGGDYQGQGGLPTANRTYIDSISTIDADALLEGNGGTVIAWADGDMQFYGEISTRGGAIRGDGGFIEVSGAENLAFWGTADAGATQGANGTLLLDPQNIRIVAGSGGDPPPDSTIDADNIFIPWTLEPFQNFTISENALENLSSNVNVRLEAANDIIIEPLEDSDQDVDVLPDLLFRDGPGGSIEFIADADNDGNGAFIMQGDDLIRALQRNITIRGAAISIGSISTASPYDSEGDAGAITLAAAGNITVNGSYISDPYIPDPERVSQDPIALASAVSIGGNGMAGKISIISANGTIDVRSGNLSASNSGEGSGAEVYIQAGSDVYTADIFSLSVEDGDGGNIQIISDRGTINTTEGNLNASTPNGNGGNVKIQAAGDILTADMDTRVSENVVGNAGSIDISSTSGIVDTTEGSLNSSALNGNGGSINITANQDVVTGRLTSSFGIGNLGNIFLVSEAGSIDTTSGIITYSPLADRDDVELIAERVARFDAITARNLTVMAGEIAQVNGTADISNTARFISTLDGVTLDVINADNLEVDSSGTIIGNGRLSIASNAGFISQMANAGTVKVSSGDDITFDNSIIGGDLIVDVAGQTEQIGILQVAGNIFVNGVANDGVDDPLVNTVGDPRQETTLPDGSVMIVGVGTVSLESADYPASLTVISLPEGILGFDEILQDTAIELTNKANFFGETVQFRTAIGDAEIIEGIPGIAQTGPISVANTATFNATNFGNIGLTAVDNQFDQVAFIGRDIGLVSSRELNLLTSRASGNLSIRSQGTIRQDSGNSVLTVLGETNLVVTGDELGNVTLGNANFITQIGQSLIGGNFNLELFERPPFYNPVVIPVPGTTLQVAGTQDDNILANNADGNNANDFSLGILPNNPYQEDGSGNVFITDIGPTDVAAILTNQRPSGTNVSGNLIVNSLAEGLRFEGEVFDDQVAIALGGQNRLFGPITIQTDAPTVVAESGMSMIIQGAPLAVSGTSAFNATGGTINLPEAANQFGVIAFDGAEVTIREQDDSRLGESRVADTLDFTSGGAITQQGNLRVGGASRFTSTTVDAPITLDRDNQLAGPISFITTGAGDATLRNTVVATQLAASQIGGDLTVDSGNRIAQTAPLNVTGLTTLNAGGNDITLTLGNDFNRVAVTGSGSTTLRDINDIVVENSRSFSNFTVTAQGNINTQDISIANGSIQLTTTGGAIDTTGGLLRARFAGGRGGNIDIRAAGDIAVGEILVNGLPSGSVNLTAETGTLLINGNDVRSSTFGSGKGGGVTLTGDTVRLANGGRVVSSAGDRGTGGTVTVNARQLLIQRIVPLQDRGLGFITGIGTDTFLGSGASGGNQIITATELVEITGTQAGDFVPNLIDQTAVLDAGLLRTGLTASSLGTGAAGNITITAPRLVIQNGAGIATAALGTEADAGAGGELNVWVDELEFRGLAGLATATLGAGAAGNITIGGRGSTVEQILPANQIFLYDGAVITADAIPEAVRDIAELFGINQFQSSSTEATSNRAGNINIAANSILLDNRSRITTSSTTGNGGNITLQDVGVLRLRRGNGIGGIFTDGGANNEIGDGGRISITADSIFAIDAENTDISARAFLGTGGGIDVRVGFIQGIKFRDPPTPLSDITIASEFGESGIADIELTAIDPTQGLAALPEVPQGPEVIEGCAVRGNTQAVAFFNVGRGGLLPAPENLMTIDAIIAEWTPLEGVDLAAELAEVDLLAFQGSEAKPYLLATCGVND